MKYISFLLLGGLCSVLWNGCSKVIIYEPSAEEAQAYANLYIPKAERGYSYYAISPEETAFSLDFNVALGGPQDAQQNVGLTVKVDPAKLASFNSENGTNYALLPTTNYILEKENYTIASGSRTSDKVVVKISPDDNLQIFNSYVLPLVVQDNNANLNIHPTFSTLYYIIQVSYPRGQVPREKVLSLGANWGLFIAPGAKGSIMLKKANHDLILYEPDATTHFTVPPKVVGVFWDAAESWYLIHDKAIVFRNHPHWAGLFSFTIKEDYSMVAANPFWLGDFWNRYTLVPFHNYLLTIDAAGIMSRQPVLTDVNATKTEVGSGFQGFKQIVAFKNEILALEQNGKLWVYTMSDLAVPSNKRLIGEGWDMYQKIMVLGTDVVGIDSAGDVYRYFDFRTDGFYPLK